MHSFWHDRRYHSDDMRHFIATIAVLLISLPALAQAQPGVSNPTPLTIQPLPTTAEPEVTHYGWQIAFVDGMSLTGSMINPSIMLAGYALAGPTVHLLHGNHSSALASLGLRMGLPVVGALAGVGLENCSNGGGSMCGLAGLLVGGVVGMGTAVILDWFVLAKRTRVRQTGPVRPGLRVGDASILPNISVDRKGNTSFGLVGNF